jgi:isopenicillin N synthase-like dioxygenase
MSIGNSESTMATAEVARAVRDLPHRPLPVLDVGPALTGDTSAIEDLAKKWREVWQNIGFMCIVNHGIPQAKIDAMVAQTKRFHDLPTDVKMQVKITQDHKGYVPPRSSNNTTSEYILSRKLSLVECYVVASDYSVDNPQVRAGKQFYGPMPWLPESVLPGFRAATEDYMATVTALGKKLLPVWARSLEMPSDFFAPMFEEPYTYFRVAKYPKKPDLHEGEFGSNPHTDTGFMTFLPPANEEGLQVLDADGTWFWPELPEGALIVNVGQFLERWTNKQFRATPHRVIPPTTRDRYSLACFVNPSFEPVCTCLPTCTSADNPPKFPPQSYWEFFEWYMTRSYTHYGKLKVDDSGTAVL